MNPIKDLRAETGLTQKAFSDVYGIPLRTIENWESGVRNPPEYVVELLRYRITTEGKTDER